ncbi:MAG: FAD-dependent oxidoreductase, partial [Acidimicrobiia bacterium]
MNGPSERYDLVIIGLGAAGAAAARMAASLELRVAVVERSSIESREARSGSIPLNALIESARVAHTIAHAGDVGVHVADLAIDNGAVWSRVAALSSQSMAESRDAVGLAAAGVDFFHGEAAVTGPHEVTVTIAPGHDSSADSEGFALPTRFVLVCTGSRPRRPDISGLDDNTSLTTDTFWSLPSMPRSVVFIGGGSVSLEMAQALSRLGVGCTVLERERRVLIDEEPVLVDQLVSRLRADGVDIVTGVNITRARRAGSLVEITGSVDGVPRRWGGEVALIAAGRVPDIEQLGLGELGIVTGPHGVVVDERGRTSVRSIYAVGDAADPGAGPTLRSAQRSHVAAHQATRAVRDMFFPGR